MKLFITAQRTGYSTAQIQHTIFCSIRHTSHLPPSFQPGPQPSEALLPFPGDPVGIADLLDGFAVEQKPPVANFHFSEPHPDSSGVVYLLFSTRML